MFLVNTQIQQKNPVFLRNKQQLPALQEEAARGDTAQLGEEAGDREGWTEGAWGDWARSSLLGLGGGLGHNWLSEPRIACPAGKKNKQNIYLFFLLCCCDFFLWTSHNFFYLLLNRKWTFFTHPNDSK